MRLILIPLILFPTFLYSQIRINYDPEENGTFSYNINLLDDTLFYYSTGFIFFNYGKLPITSSPAEKLKIFKSNSADDIGLYPGKNGSFVDKEHYQNSTNGYNDGYNEGTILGIRRFNFSNGLGKLKRLYLSTNKYPVVGMTRATLYTANPFFKVEDKICNVVSDGLTAMQLCLFLDSNLEINKILSFQVGSNYTKIRQGIYHNGSIYLIFNEFLEPTNINGDINSIIVRLDRALNYMDAHIIRDFVSFKFEIFDGNFLISGRNVLTGISTVMQLDSNYQFIAGVASTNAVDFVIPSSASYTVSGPYNISNSNQDIFINLRNKKGYSVLTKTDRNFNTVWSKVVPAFIDFVPFKNDGGYLLTTDNAFHNEYFGLWKVNNSGISDPELLEYCGIALEKDEYYKDKISEYHEVHNFDTPDYTEDYPEFILKEDSLTTEPLNFTFKIPEPDFLDKQKWCSNACDTLISADIGIVDSSYFKVDNITTDGLWCPMSAGVHDVTHVIIYNGGCMDSISKTTFVEQAPTLSLQDSAIICKPSEGVSVIADGSPGSKILWNNQYTDGATSKVFYTTGYEIVSAQYNHCTTTDSVYINTIEALVDGWPNFLPDEVGVFCDGEEAIVGIENVNNAVYYTWSDGSHESRISVHQSQNLTVSGELYGCMARDSVRVTFKDCRTAQIFVPNVFSPNHDGVNDELEVFGLNIEIKSFKIFNRWGSELFSGQDSNLKWDGTYRGLDMPNDTYVYFVVYKDLITNAERVEKGSVQVVR